MKLSRRNFLAWAGLSAVGAVACEGFGIREGEFSLQSPAALPEDLVRGKDNWYATLCRTCPSCEGIVVRVMEGRAKKVQGNPSYPTNMGKHSARCEAGLQALYHPDRVSGPMRRSSFRGSGQFEPIDWETGLNEFRSQLQARSENMLAITGPVRGHLAMVVNKFAQAMGGRHLAFEPMDSVTYRMALKNVFDQETLPDFDIGNANFLLSFGSDLLSTWIAPNRWSLGYGEFRNGENRDKRGTFYHVDPRFSMTAANADQWVPITPGWEGYLALSLAYVIISEGLQAPGVDVGRLTGGRGAAALEGFRPEDVAGRIVCPKTCTDRARLRSFRAWHGSSRQRKTGPVSLLAVGPPALIPTVCSTWKPSMPSTTWWAASAPKAGSGSTRKVPFPTSPLRPQARP